jgi:VCBS repeat-containing protein
VLSNDSDIDNDPLTSVLVTGVSNGSLTLNVDGSFSYTPNTGYTGSDSFTYKASDGSTQSADATVTITVNAVGGNNTPVASGDAYSVDQDTILSVNAPGVLGNDSDPDVGDSITAVQDSSAGNGNAVLNADGSFTYTPNAGYSGTDSFTYYAVDNNGAGSNQVTVTITVNSTGATSCSDITDKGTCNNEPTCEWSGSPRNGSCNDVAACTPTEPTEVSCSDGNDNDCDGAVDCSDSDCSGDPACQQADCTGYEDKNSCNAQATCRWDNKGKSCINN